MGGEREGALCVCVWGGAYCTELKFMSNFSS